MDVTKKFGSGVLPCMEHTGQGKDFDLNLMVKIETTSRRGLVW